MLQITSMIFEGFPRAFPSRIAYLEVVRGWSVLLQRIDGVQKRGRVRPPSAAAAPRLLKGGNITFVRGGGNSLLPALDTLSPPGSLCLRFPHWDHS